MQKNRLGKKGVAHNQLDSGGGKAKQLLICTFLVVATFIVYWQVQSYEFVNFDDNRYVTENENIKEGVTSKSIIWAFTTPYPPFWHPVSWLSHMLDYQLYGLNPKGHHLTNILFHITNALLLFMVLVRMTGALWQSCFVAAIFALHPLNVESVAWITERKNVLSTFFWLLTMWAYIRYAEKTSIKRYCLVALFLTFGLMSKPVLVTLPFVLLMLDFWPLGRLKPGKKKESVTETKTGKYADKGANISRLIWEKIPLLAIAVGSSIMTVAFRSSDRTLKLADMGPLQARIVNALVSYLEYLEKMLWPRELSVLYPHPGNALPVWQGVVCGIVLMCISILVVRMIRRAPYLAVGWFWYLGTLVPVIGIVQVGRQAMADRFTYIPLIGIFIIVAWGLPELLAKWRYRNKALAILGGILIPILMALSWVQASHWENNKKLYNHAIEVTDNKYPGFALIYSNLGAALIEQEEFKEAIIHFQEAIRLKPDYAKAHYNLGVTLGKQMKFDEAVIPYKEAIRLKPDYTDAHNNLGTALIEQEEFKEAIIRFQEAIRLKPDYAEAHNNLGNALVKQRAFDEAISHYKESIRLKPDYAEAHYNLGIALGKQMKFDEAISYYREVIRLKPDYAEAHNNLGSTLGEQGNFEEAIVHFEIAIKIDPEHAQAKNNLRMVRSAANQPQGGKRAARAR